MEAKAHPQQGFRAILGLLRLTKSYGDERVDAACARALVLNALSYRNVESILKNNLDRHAGLAKTPEPQPIAHPARWAIGRAWKATRSFTGGCPPSCASSPLPRTTAPTGAS